MQNQFITLVALASTDISQAIKARDNDVVMNKYSSPEPKWLMHDDYTSMATPDDFGSFVNNVESASFAIWDDSENPDLRNWV